MSNDDGVTTFESPPPEQEPHDPPGVEYIPVCSRCWMDVHWNDEMGKWVHVR